MPCFDDRSPAHKGVPLVSGGGALVQSLNFEFPRPHVALLADLGGFAEKSAHPDPPSATVKLRAFAEELVEQVYEHYRLRRPYEARLSDLLENHAFTAAAPNVIQTHLHALRRSGNKGAHGAQVTTDAVLRRLEDALALGRWFFISVLGCSPGETPQRFNEPPPESTKAQFKKKSRELQEEVARLREIEAAKEEALAGLQAALKSERDRAGSAEAAKQEAERAS